MKPELERVITKWGKLIDSVCAEVGLDQHLVAAMVTHESMGDPYAVRFESGWKYFWFTRAWAEKLSISVNTETALQQISWGLMQIMGSVARQQGFEGQLVQLAAEPETGLRYACLYLKHVLGHWPSETDAISAYNQGSPRKTVGGMYENQSTYVDPVYAYLVDLRSLKS